MQPRPVASSAIGADGTLAAARSWWAAGPFWRYALLLVLAEFLLAFLSPELGILLHAGALVGLVSRHIGTGTLDGPTRAVLLGLALIPLTRLLSLAMPLDDLDVATWYVLAGVPSLLALVGVARAVGLTSEELGFGAWGPTRRDGAILGVGLAAGLLAHLLGVAPVGTPVDGDVSRGLGIVISLVVFVAAFEELLFRGVLQRLVIEAAGITGLAMVAVLYATALLSTFSVGAVIILGALGVVFAVARLRGVSMPALIAAHALALIGPAALWPWMLG